MSENLGVAVQALTIILKTLDDDDGVSDGTFDDFIKPFVRTHFGDTGLAILEDTIDLLDGRVFLPEDIDKEKLYQGITTGQAKPAPANDEQLPVWIAYVPILSYLPVPVAAATEKEAEVLVNDDEFFSLCMRKDIAFETTEADDQRTILAHFPVETEEFSPLNGWEADTVDERTPRVRAVRAEWDAMKELSHG